MFESLLSNNRMKQELTRAVTQNRPMHAYLFCGSDGSGKLTAAKLLARELVGVNPEKADRGSHPDIFILKPEKDKKLISVEQVRNMRNDAFINPSEALRKIYIINGVELMNEAGQNALLTILEQPPSFAIFILLSESREKVLPTVVSRCAVFEMEYVDADEGAEFLHKQMPSIPLERLKVAMTAAEGNIGFAAKIAADEIFDTNIQKCQKLALAAAEKDEYTAAKLLTPLTKEQAIEFLPILALFLKDITISRLAPGANLVFKENILQNKTQFDKIDINILYDAVAGCEKSLELIAGNVNCQLIMASLVIQLCGGKQID